MSSDGSDLLLEGQSQQTTYNSTTMDNPGFVGREDVVELLEVAVLTKKERELLHLAEEDDVDGVKQLLQSHPRTNVNAVDYQGRSALQIAVRNQCEDMVDFLLTVRGIKLRDAILFAIYEENMNILEMLMDWEQSAKKAGYVEEPFDSAEFPSHMTPLMLASIENNYEAVKLLLVRGHTISIPSNDDYKDSDYAHYGETLEVSLARIDSYRALSSPTYLCLSSQDPILMAFKLSHEADNLAFADPIFKDEYVALSKQCRDFAVQLLDQCRSSEEVWVLLKQDHGAETGVKRGGEYPRLRLAMNYEQQEFITHQNCQQVLQNLWTENNPDVMWMNFIQRLFYFTPRLFILPFVHILYFFFPFPNIYKYWEAPMCKFMGDVLSYLIFLVLLLLSILHGEENPGKRVPDLNNGIDVCIWIWIASYIWDEIKIFYHYGLKIYMRNWWLLYGFVMNMCFLTSFVARLASYILAEDDDEYDPNLPRTQWPWNDPILVSEAMYCIATVLAFGRVLYIFQISQVLGPLQLSLSRMLYDISQMFCLIFIAMFSFATGMTRLYVFYEGSVRVDEDGNTQEQEDAFTSWLTTFKTLFWIIFGYGEVEYADIVVDNTCSGDGILSSATGNESMCDAAVSHKFTEGTGYFLYGLYHLIMVATLLNMLIGLMSNTLNKIQENADQEWKFSRSRLWMQYLEDSSFLPNPLNVIPSVGDIVYFMKWLTLLCCCRQSDKEARWSKDQCWYIDDKQEDVTRKQLEQKYKVVMQRLMQRYMNKREQSEQLDVAVTPDDLEQLKIDLIKEMHKLHGKGGIKHKLSSLK